MHWLRRAALSVAIAVGYGITATAVAAAWFDAGTNAAMTVTTKRIFPTSQSTTAWDVQDASAGGTAASATDTWAAVDGRTFTTATLGTSFSTTRYVELTMSTPLPAAIPVSSVTLNLTMAASGGGTGCVYAEIRRASTNALLGTQGSSSSPLACSSTTTQATTTSSLTYVTSSTDADDLKVKLFVRSSLAQKIAFDRVTVTGTSYSTSFTLGETTVSNSSSGTATSAPWALAAADATTLSPASAWAAAFDTTRYLKFSFPSVVPTGASISSVQLRLAYASATTSTSSCVYVEIYNGATLVGSRGSSASPLSCSTTTTQVTDVLDLTEVDTVTEANNLVAKVYVRNGSVGQTRHGLATMTVDYSLA